MSRCALVLTPVCLMALCGLASNASAQAPSNDVCANAITLTLASGGAASASGTTATATIDGTATCGSSNSAPDVWYRVVVPTTGNLTFSTCGSTNSYDTVLQVRTSCPGSGVDLACNDDTCGLLSTVTLTARPAGEQLWVRVGGFGTGPSNRGTFTLSVQHIVAGPPVNDLCANATPINLGTELSVTQNVSNVLATTDGPAGCVAGSGSDIWYSIVVPSAGNIIIDTCGASTEIDTVVSAYSACGGTLLGCNDDGSGCSNVGSRLTISSVVAGQSILIRVAGVGGQQGAVNMVARHTLPATPPNPLLGPDVITGTIVDVARWGTDPTGLITAYSVGTDSCNPGDYPVLWIDSNAYLPDYNNTQHPVISQNMFRLKNMGGFSRFEQLGQSWLKHGFVSTNSNACALCGTRSIWRPSLQAYQNVGGDVLGVNCSDTYGSGLNGAFGSLGAKNIVNATVGTSAFVRGNGTGDSTTKMRLQVPTSDVAGQPAGTRFFVEGYYVTADDAQFVRPGETVAINGLNNASYREITAASINASPTLTGGTVQRSPGIGAWKAADATVSLVTADHDDAPNPGFPGSFIRSRYWVAAKATALAGGQYRYEYAVYNLNSDRSAGTFSVPLPAGATMTGVYFRAPQWHSGEPYSNAAWTNSRAGDVLTFATQPFAVNANANAIRWGSMYNFGFTSNIAPVTGNASIGLFKAGTAGAPNAVAVVGVPVPEVVIVPTCPADFNADGDLNPDDLADYIGAFFTVPAGAQADFNGDGEVNPDDLADYIGAFFAGC